MRTAFENIREKLAVAIRNDPRFTSSGTTDPNTLGNDHPWVADVIISDDGSPWCVIVGKGGRYWKVEFSLNGGDPILSQNLPYEVDRDVFYNSAYQRTINAITTKAQEVDIYGKVREALKNNKPIPDEMRTGFVVAVGHDFGVRL